jgi:hypothetical protein
MKEDSMKTLKIIILLAGLALIGGCEDEPTCYDDEYPAAPTGVNSVTGDESILIYWYAVGENDIDHYSIYRSDYGPDEDFSRIATVSESTTEYIDNDVVNGHTYYYRIRAVDNAGHRSVFSDYAMDTPRPEGANVVIYDYHDGANYNRTGFDFYAHNRVPYNTDDCDIFLDYDTGLNVFFINVRFNDYYIQDYGYAANFDEIGYAPEAGWSALKEVEAIEGHVYLLKLYHFEEWHYAKIRVQHLENSQRSMTFAWAYQTDPGNRELKVKSGAVKHPSVEMVSR